MKTRRVCAGWALAAARGVAVLGPLQDGRQLFAPAGDWLRAAPPAQLGGTKREAALAELARRYLAGHGPATAADLAAWVGLPLRDARAGLTGIAAELVELGDELVELGGSGRTPGRLPARLLPAFDPYLLGWKDRSFAVHCVTRAQAIFATAAFRAAGVRRGDRLEHASVAPPERKSTNG